MTKRVRLAAIFTFAVAVLVASSQPAAAADRKACFAAADDGQKLRDEQSLIAAREAFIVCADRACPKAVVAQCTQWLEEVDRELPSILFRIRDASGKEVFDAQIYADGAQTPLTVQAKSVAQNPGNHKIRVVLASGKSHEDSYFLRKGERDRLIEIAFPLETQAGAQPPKETPSSPKPASFQVPVLAWVGLGVSVLGGVGTAVFAISANGQERDVRNSGCAPACDPSKRSSIDSSVTLANVSLAVGAVGLSVAVVATIVANLGGGAEKPAPPKRAQLAPRVFLPVVAPAPQGMQAAWLIAF